MNVLLIYPPNPDYCILTEEFSCCEPLGLEYVAAALLPRHDVDLMDMRFEKDLKARLGTNRYDAVGVAIPFTTSINTCNRVLHTIRECRPDVVTIVGGHYPSTTLAKIDLRHVDYVVVGEGVETIVELLDAIERRQDVSTVAGIAVVRDGEACYTPRREPAELDACPIPARVLLEPYADTYFHAHYTPITLMRFSAGCPFNCSFCILWKMTDRQYFIRSDASIIEELSQIQNTNIYVVDDEAFIQPKRMLRLAEAMAASGLRKKFHMYVRSDTIANNPLLFEKWAAVGLDSVLVGLESVFDDDLQEYRKNISLDIARRCVEVLHDNGVEIRANFIVKPDYTVDRFKYIRDIVYALDIDRPTFSVLTPFAGTDTYAEVEKELILDKPEFYDCYHTLMRTTLDLRTFYKEFAELFREAQRRDPSPTSSKIFYSGKGGAFSSFVDKIEHSYVYY
jgi:radical SAM superfamily enzyme YgiQ (UPF0313 family)